MSLDPTSNIGKLRLRVADYSDLPYLPDSVYVSVLEDNEQNLSRSAKVISQYILGMLSHKTHRKMAQLEIWGAEGFKNYKEFLLLTISNPSFMDLSPVPIVTSVANNPLIDFQNHWNKNFTSTTEAEQLADYAGDL